MMHDDQLAIDAETAGALIAGQFPHLRGEPVRQLAGSGTVNAIFRVGAALTARFPMQPQAPEVAAEILRAEAAAAAEFADNAPVPAPRVIGIGQPGPHYPMPWTLQTWIDGSIAAPDGLAASPTFAEDIAILIATLRQVPTAGRRFDGRGRGGDLATHDAWMATCLANSRSLFDVDRLEHLWASFRALARDDEDTMSHRDLIPANLLVNGDRLKGVLDTGSFGPADPALDLVSAWHLFDTARRQLIRTRLSSSDLQWHRGAAWAFVQSMGLVWYYDTTNPPMAKLGRSTLHRLLADPEISGH
jgi:aminoglycoside phosphotransferase (APT) family kinase protein